MASASSEVPVQQMRAGPILYLRGCDNEQLLLAALVVRPEHEDAPVMRVGQVQVAPDVVCRRSGLAVLRYEFSLSAIDGGEYALVDGDGEHEFQVAGVGQISDLRIAYVSCNGQERGDWDRPLEERNTMWRRMVDQHRDSPFHLLLQGGDQLYVDEMLDVAPEVRAWGDGEDPEPISSERSAEIGSALRDFLLRSYLTVYRQPAPAWLLARVPTLCMWDDHDICDGWGSLPADRLDAPIGRLVFEAAREFFLLFQLGSVAEELAPMFLDPTGATLTWSVRLPSVRLIAPDLRSERRPDRILGPAGWEALERTLAEAHDERVLLLSSVPVLGPRLSWVETVMRFLPGAQKYEDDLRDQWQSRTHRDQWRRLLRTLLSVHERGDAPVTILSGEIHLATRGKMRARGVPMHQLVASGITHPPPPRLYARCLGALAWLGESPLKAHPIRMYGLPGRRGIYTADRNYMVLRRREGRWSVQWELERTGTTPPLDLD